MKTRFLSGMAIAVVLFACNNQETKTSIIAAKAPGDATTHLKIVNANGAAVTVWITLGATAGCLHHISLLPFITDSTGPLQGSFILAPHDSVEVTAPPGLAFNGNISFNTPPMNCSTPAFPNGVNIFECIINNSFQGKGAQETIDISCVAGVNCAIKVLLSGGQPWNAGPTAKEVNSFFNRGLKNNSGLVGVYPYGCDICTGAKNPPSCISNSTDKQKADICNVQRDAMGSGGGIIRVIYEGKL